MIQRLNQGRTCCYHCPALGQSRLCTFLVCAPFTSVMSEQTCGRSSAAPPSCGPQERTSPHHHHLTHQHQPAPDPPLSSAQLSSGGPRALTALTTPPHPPPAPLCSTSSLEERIRHLANQSRHLPRVFLFICDPPFGTL